MWLLGQLFILGYLVVRTYQLCPQSCRCNNNLLTVHCTGSSLDPTLPASSTSNLNEIPIFLNPRIQRLNLEGNQIRDLRESLQFYADLRHLDVSGNRISNLGSYNFENLKKLEYLNVSYNQVSILSEFTLRGLTGLISLDLSHNQLEGMDYKVFHNLTLLSLLDLSHNRFEFIDWSIFYGLSSLQVLSLRNNFIKKLERLFVTGPWTLSSLAELDLSYNQLTSLDGTNFDAFVNVRILQLCCNKIHKFVGDNVFNSNLKLVELNLSQNHITSLPMHLLSRLTELKSIDLSSNHLKSISSHYFHSLFKLEVLDISNNNGIMSIHSSALLDNINLVQFRGDSLLYLSNISISLLINKPFLSLFSLRYANLSTIDFQSNYQLVDTLDLTGNPWNCNCSSLGLYSYMKSSNESKLSHSIVCSVPAKVQGVPLIALSSSHFHDCNHIQDSFTNTVLILAAILVILIVLLILFKIFLILGLIKLPTRTRIRRGEGDTNNSSSNNTSVSRNSFKAYHYHQQQEQQEQSPTLEQQHQQPPQAYNHHHHHPHNLHPHHHLYHPPQHGPPVLPPLHPQYPPQQQHYRYQQQFTHPGVVDQVEYNEDLFHPRNPSNNLTTLQKYTHTYDKQVPSVLV